MRTASELLTMGKRQLADELERGHPIDPSALDDTEYRGVSLGLPAWMERLTWKKFRKTFHRDPVTGRLRGWNVRLVQNGLDAEDEPMRRRDGTPISFGHYEVISSEGLRVPKGSQGLIIDYGRGGNGALATVNLVRDPLVALNEGSVDLLLGWSYVDLGFATFGTPSYFTLERPRPLASVVEPPGRPRALP